MQPVESSSPALPAGPAPPPAASPLRGAPWNVKLVAGVLAFLVGVIVGVGVRQAVWPTGISRASYDRITQGMSRAQVEAVLGPPGIYSNWWNRSASMPTELRSWDEAAIGPSQAARWEGVNGVIRIASDDSGHVIGKTFFAPTESLPYHHPTLLENLTELLQHWLS